MRKLPFILVLSLCASGSFAQTSPDPVASDDRFQIERQGDQIIRLDRKTGAISTCTLKDEQLDCRSSADERAALNAEIERLEAELAALRDGSAKGEEADNRTLTLKLPSEQDMREVAAFLETMFNRFISAVKNLADGNA